MNSATDLPTPDVERGVFEHDRLVHVDEASLYNTSVNRLLYEGANGTIEVLFECAPAYALVLKPTRVGLGPRLIGRPENSRIPEYLVLEPGLCESLLSRKGGIKVYEAATGYRKLGFNRKGNATGILRLAANCANDPDHDEIEICNVEGDAVETFRQPWSHWCFVADGHPCAQVVGREDLYVRRLQLIDLLGLRIDEDPSSLYQPKDTETFGKNISSYLSRMLEATNKFWGDIPIEDRDSYPTVEKVTKWFESAGFSKTLAVAAATLIRPDGADSRGGRRTK